MKPAIELLQRSLGFISWIKSEEGENVDEENLEGDIISFLEKLECTE